MTEIDEGAYSQSAEAVPVEKPVVKEVVEPVKVEAKQSSAMESVAKSKTAVPVNNTIIKPKVLPKLDLAAILLERIDVGSTVRHKKFGKGEVVKINKNEKFIFVKFMLGEKKFMFPDAFFDGFLEIE